MQAGDTGIPAKALTGQNRDAMVGTDVQPEGDSPARADHPNRNCAWGKDPSMRKKGMNRRQFLQTSGVALASAAVAGSTGMLWLSSARAWALSTATLNEHTAKTLVLMCRHLYPHKAIEDGQYGVAVAGFDKKAAVDPAFAKLLQDGVASLDAAAPGKKWVEASDEVKLQALKSIESSPFFQTVRGTLVGPAGPYNLPAVWKPFGYEGSSWQFGGYLARGFDDIGWLPKN